MGTTVPDYPVMPPMAMPPMATPGPVMGTGAAFGTAGVANMVDPAATAMATTVPPVGARTIDENVNPEQPDGAYHDGAYHDAAYHEEAYHDEAHPEVAHPDEAHPDEAHPDEAYPEAAHPDGVQFDTAQPPEDGLQGAVDGHMPPSEFHQTEAGQAPLLQDTGAPVGEMGMADGTTQTSLHYCVLAAIPLSIGFGIIAYILLGRSGTSTTTTASEDTAATNSKDMCVLRYYFGSSYVPSITATNTRFGEGEDLANGSVVPSIDIVMPFLNDLGITELGPKVAEQFIYLDAGDVVMALHEPEDVLNSSEASHPTVCGTGYNQSTPSSKNGAAKDNSNVQNTNTNSETPTTGSSL
ncbi:uncharacterized protein LOC135399212 [Ornithodoros turicata]|uniref:uncharacterized protein LOC135399212 n=1 Tax=Ornithodoros turicata TaxID=34597 RepID=UPI003138C069